MKDVLGLIDALRVEGEKADPAELARRFGVDEQLVQSTMAALARQPVQRVAKTKNLRHTLTGTVSKFSNRVKSHWLPHLVIASLPLIALQWLVLTQFVPLNEKVPNRELHVPLLVGAACLWLGLFLWKVASWHKARRSWLLFLGAPLTMLPMGIPSSLGVVIGFSLAYAVLAGLALLVVNLRATSAEGARRANPSRQELVARALDLRKALAETEFRGPVTWFERALEAVRLKPKASFAVFLTCFFCADLLAQLRLDEGKVDFATGGVLLLAWCVLATLAGQRVRPVMWLSAVTLAHLAAVQLAANVRGQQIGLLGIVFWFAVPLPLLMVLAIAVGQVFAARRRTSKIQRGDRAILIEELLDAEHRLRASTGEVTAVVVDVAGSTEMKKGLDPLAVEWTYREYQAMLAATAIEHGGRVLSTAGDGAVLSFEDSQAAVACSLSIQSRIEEFNSGVSRIPVPFRLRIGVHCGEVQGELGEVQFSRVIDVAAHVEALSPVGKVAITDTVASKLYGFTAAGLERTTDGHGILLVEKGVGTTD